MPSTYTANLGIEKPGSGEQSGTWGDTANDNFDIIDRAINGVITLSLAGTSSTLTTTDGALSNGQYKVLVLGGSPSGTHTITISPATQQKLYYVYNTTAQSVIFTQGSGGNVTIAAGDSAIIYSNGAGATAAVVNISDHLAFASIKITGGAIDGTPVGATTPAAGTFTTGTFTTGTFGLGAVGTPSITITGDTNTGLWSPGADTLAVSTAGSERLRVDSSGNVGVGVTPSAWEAQFGVLELRGTGAYIASNGSNRMQVGTNSYADTAGTYRYAGSNFAAAYIQVTGQHQWYTAPSGTAGNPITFTQAMTLDGSGNLGVGGTANAAAILDLISTTKGFRAPSMTTTQRDAIASPVAGLLIYNTTLNFYQVYNGTAWTSVGGGATGGGTDQVFFENGQTVTTNYTITDGKNAMSAGPITINAGITVTVGAGEVWTIV